MPERIAKWLGQKLFAWATQEQVWIPGVNMEYTTSTDNSASSINANNAKDRSAELAQVKEKFWLTRTPTFSEIKNYQSSWKWSDDLTTTTLSTGQKVNNSTMNISTQNSTLWKDPAVDNIIASQYMKADDKKYESYVDKIGMETGIYADIQNLDEKVLDTYKILWMSDQDIFSRQDLSPEEKIAMSWQRKDIATNRITQLRKIQQAKQNEIKELADYEAKKAEAQEKEYKASMEYMKQINEAQKLNLDLSKFKLDALKAWEDIKNTIKSSNLDREKLELDRAKFMASEVTDSNLLPGTFNTLWVWEKYGNWNVSQTYGTSSVLSSDNVKLVNWQVWTPWLDLAGNLWDSISAFAWGTVLKVVSGKSNMPVTKWASWDYWNQVVIKDTSWKIHYYNHLDSVWNFKEWQEIQRGQQIWTMGNSGTSTWVHLDYRVKSNNWWEDPRVFLNKKADKTANVDYSTAFDYLNSTVPNVDKLITPETAKNILISDMTDFTLPKEKIKNLATLWKVPTTLVDDYTSIRYAKQYYGTLNEDWIVKALKDEDFWVMSDEEKLTTLVELELAWKLDTDWLFEWWYLSIDGKWFDLLQDHFDDLNESIKLAKDIAAETRKKYNLN